MRVLRTRRLLFAIGSVTAALAVVTPVEASQSVTLSGTTKKCTVTALAPTLVGTNLTGQASVVCNFSSSVSVDIAVVEMDGTAEDTQVPIPVATKSVAVSANKAVTITTATKTCLNTETGNEEYASKTRVNISGTVSAWDRTSPATDAYAC